MHPSVSVVTIVKNRIDQLINLVSSIEQADQKPDELIVVWMTSPCPTSLLTSPCFSIRHKFMTHDVLPITKARNKGFLACMHEHIIYMDVDCLCPHNFFTHVVEAMRPGRVVTSQILYLCHTPKTFNYSALQKEAQCRPDEDYCFRQDDPHFSGFNTYWFAILLRDFIKIGCFDEQYEGFGVSDVDFTTRCKQADMSLYILPDKVLHQFHPRLDPPINHLSDIVNNAQRYRNIWGTYPLKEWLHAFAQNGLINQDYDTRGLKVRRLPSYEEIQAYMTQNPY